MLVLGSGFLGKQLKEDYNAIGVSRGGQHGIKADLSLKKDYLKLPKDEKVIVFAASPDSSSVESYQQVYLEAFSHALSYAKEIKDLERFILISSTGVYGQSGGESVDEKTPATPSRDNAKVIVKAENLLANSGLNYSVIRFAGIYGPGRNRFIEKAKQGELDLATCTYSNRIHVKDCARVVAHAISKKGELYIGVDNSPCDTREVILWIRSKLGLESNYNLEHNFVKGKRCLNKKLLSEGFEFKYPSYKEGYSEMIEALKL